MKVLVTCPPMLGMIDTFRPRFAAAGVELVCPDVVQTLSEDELIALVPAVDGWIIGDDPATQRVFAAGRAGRLRAAVKWGIGVDNVDRAACETLDIPVTNTPDMFGNEVADIAMNYITGLARQTYDVDRAVRAGNWPKPRGMSLQNKRVALVGYGDIGRETARRMLAARMQIMVYDPATRADQLAAGLELRTWPGGLETADFIVVTCSLSESSHHLVDAAALASCPRGVRVVNVSRGPVVDEQALIEALGSGQVAAAALDVMETEPLPVDSPLRQFEHMIFGSHNASNTDEGVKATSERAIDALFSFLGVNA